MEIMVMSNEERLKDLQGDSYFPLVLGVLSCLDTKFRDVLTHPTPMQLEWIVPILTEMLGQARRASEALHHQRTPGA